MSNLTDARAWLAEDLADPSVVKWSDERVVRTIRTAWSDGQRVPPRVSREVDLFTGVAI